MGVGQTEGSGVGGVATPPPLGGRLACPLIGQKAYLPVRSPRGYARGCLCKRGERGAGRRRAWCCGRSCPGPALPEQPWPPMGRAAGMGCPVPGPGVAGVTLTVPLGRAACCRGCRPAWVPAPALCAARALALRPPSERASHTGRPVPRGEEGELGVGAPPSCSASASFPLRTCGLPWGTGRPWGSVGGTWQCALGQRGPPVLAPCGFLKTPPPFPPPAGPTQAASFPPLLLPCWACRVCRGSLRGRRGSLTGPLWVMASGRDLFGDSWGPGGAPHRAGVPTPRPLNPPPPLESVLPGGPGRLCLALTLRQDLDPAARARGTPLSRTSCGSRGFCVHSK